jgi:hypothetical protein
MSRRVVALVPLLLALLVPAAARAEAQWLHDSALAEQTTGYLPCAGTGGGPIHEVLPSVDYAEVFLDTASPPPLGAVQYVRVQWYATGGDYCREQGGTGAALEIIPPPGTELAISAENPALCGFDTLQNAVPCPVIATPGDYGGTLLNDGRSGQPALWPVSDGLNKTRLQVPLKFTSAVASFGTSPERFCNAGPCPAASTGGRVQFTARFVPGTGGAVSKTLLTTVGIDGGASSAAAPGPGPSPGKTGRLPLTANAPKPLTFANLRAGWPVKLKVAAGATAKARLLVGKLVVATAKKTAKKAGPLQLKLKASPKTLTRLGSKKRAAKLTVSVTKKGTKPQSVTAPLTLEP